MYEKSTVEQVKKVIQKGLFGGSKKGKKRGAAAAGDMEDTDYSVDESEDEDDDNRPKEDKLADFRKGFSEYLLTKYYLKKRKDGSLES